MKLLICIICILLVPFFSPAQHKLLLKSGESMNGEVVAIKDGILSYSFKGNLMNFKINEISLINFSEGKEPALNVEQKTISSSGTKGVSFVMNGRKMIRQPVVNNLTAEKGIVVVEITINKYGNVIKAKPGAEGTTTTSQYLLTKAQQAAESVIFNTFQIAPLEQTGTITIIF